MINGDTITFSNSSQCSGSGTYQWSVTDGVLRFVQRRVAEMLWEVY